MTRWIKNGQPPSRPLPYQDSEPDGTIWTNLANNPEGRAACGWEPAGVPFRVSRMQAKQYLLAAGMLGNIETAIVNSGDPALELYWGEASYFHRDHPKLTEFFTSIGLTGQQVDEMFIAAADIL